MGVVRTILFLLFAPLAFACASTRLLTLKWLDDFIIGHKLCPFAAAARRSTRVVVEQGDERAALMTIESELHSLRAVPTDKAATTLVVLPRLQSFEALVQFRDASEGIAESDVQAARVQMLAFHPDAAFGYDDDDPADWSMRSPFPMLHLLRDSDVEAADKLWAAQHAPNDPPGIQERNAAYLRGLGHEAAASAARACIRTFADTME